MAQIEDGLLHFARRIAAKMKQANWVVSIACSWADLTSLAPGAVASRL
jgi:hypothetical protein